uniref:Uncharacterized protein n=1 Tax=Rhinolophus ferrumequinum TaxID=59479 RepID=A0A671DJG8_RHIFE
TLQNLYNIIDYIPLTDFRIPGGGNDNILCRGLTMMLCLGGTVHSLYCLGWASFPYKK